MGEATGSTRRAALIAGLGYLAIAVLAPIANFGVLQKIVAPGDARTTALNLAAAEGRFRFAIAAFLVVAALDVVVALALHVLFQSVDRSLSLLSSLFRVVYTTMFAVSLNHLVVALRLESPASTLLALDAFQSGWDLSLIIFGLHLVLLGILIHRSPGRRMWILSLLVIVAGLGYVVYCSGKLLAPHRDLSAVMIAFGGEIPLMLWLLWKGVRRPQLRG